MAKKTLDNLPRNATGRDALKALTVMDSTYASSQNPQNVLDKMTEYAPSKYALTAQTMLIELTGLRADYD